MAYNKYLSKIIFKNKLNLIPIGLVMVVMLFFLIMSHNTAKQTNFISFLETDISLMEGSLGRQSDYIEDPDITEQDRVEIEEANAELASNISKVEQSIEFAKQKKWTEAIDIQLNRMEENEIKDISNGKMEISDGFVQETLKKRSAYRELSRLNIEPEIEYLETHGTTFSYRMMESVFPVIFILSLIAIVSNIVCASIFEKIDIEKLFPGSQLVFQFKKILLIVLFGILFYGVFLMLSFLSAAILGGIGSLNYPINMYSDRFDKTITVGSLLIKSSSLQILSIFFVSGFVYLISLFTKNPLSTLFVSTIVIVGPSLLTGKIGALYKYLHFLPTTYFNSVQTITNQFVVETKNSSITYYNGLIVLMLSSIFIVGLIIFIKSSDRNNEMLLRDVK